MIHADYQVLDWLRAHCSKDRVLYNALNNHSNGPSFDYAEEASWTKGSKGWRVVATCTSGKVILVIVVPHPVTQEPHHYYRCNDLMEEVADRAVGPKDE